MKNSETDLCNNPSQFLTKIQNEFDGGKTTFLSNGDGVIEVCVGVMTLT
jgi:hypothetical protein